MHFAAVRPAHRTSLVFFTIVLLSTGALAVYYLFVNRSTRFATRPALKTSPTKGPAVT